MKGENNQKDRIDNLTTYILGLIKGKSGTALLNQNHIREIAFTPFDVVYALDNVMAIEPDLDKIKVASSKLFNILNKNFTSVKKTYLHKIKFLELLKDDNNGVKESLSKNRKNIQKLNKKIEPDVLKKLILSFKEYLLYSQHYLVLQNILFPQIEKLMNEHRCLKIMWSFQDDVRMNIKKTLEVLDNLNLNLVLFNKYSSLVYFGINTLIFREEEILFPILAESIDSNLYLSMGQQLQEFKLKYVDVLNVLHSDKINKEEIKVDANLIKLSTGVLTLQQLELIFKNLPVDMTFIDENDEVRFYSDPDHRIFPRSVSIIGRKVQNCHPQESVELVNEIVEAFKSGKKNCAKFWFMMGEKEILINYFAIRSSDNKYKGVLEVSQEISEIKQIKGTQRLLDWGK